MGSRQVGSAGQEYLEEICDLTRGSGLLSDDR